MKTKNAILAVLLSAGALLAADADKTKAGKVTVIFDHPENFTDVKDAYMPTDKGRDAILDQIKQCVETQGASCLGSGQTLEVKFTEIDLAAWRAHGYDNSSVVADPCFMDPARDDYRLRPESPLHALGFASIPFDRIGPGQRSRGASI